MLVVRRKKETDPLPPLHGVQGLTPPDRKALERYREGVWVKTSKGSLGQVALEGESHGDGFEVLERYQGGVH